MTDFADDFEAGYWDGYRVGYRAGKDAATAAILRPPSYYWRLALAGAAGAILGAAIWSACELIAYTSTLDHFNVETVE